MVGTRANPSIPVLDPSFSPTFILSYATTKAYIDMQLFTFTLGLIYTLTESSVAVCTMLHLRKGTSIIDTYNFIKDQVETMLFKNKQIKRISRLASE